MKTKVYKDGRLVRVEHTDDELPEPCPYCGGRLHRCSCEQQAAQEAAATKATDI